MAFGEKIDQRKLNKRNHIIDIFRKHEVLSKIQAKEFSAYSMDTIISVFNSLIKDKIIYPVEGEQKSKGRKASFYTLKDSRQLYIGLTFNQSGLYSSLVSFSHRIISKNTTTFKPGISKDLFLENLRNNTLRYVKIQFKMIFLSIER